ncbi:isochorismatase family protein [Natrialba swarupiae]|nr:isochorismatase family protein [Natrialba swarupiae]
MVDKAEFGGEIGLGEDIAVLVVDMTREFVEDDYPNGYAETGQPAASAIARLMESERAWGPRILLAVSQGEHRVEAGQWGEANQTEEMTELTTELSPTEDDVVFEKYKPSVFFGTQLESMLNYSNVDTVIVTGMTTSGCVRATVVDAFSLNYRVIVPECVADRSQVSHEVSLFDMDMKYADVVSLDDLIEALNEAS